MTEAKSQGEDTKEYKRRVRAISYKRRKGKIEAKSGHQRSSQQAKVREDKKQYNTRDITRQETTLHKILYKSGSMSKQNQKQGKTG